MGQLGRLRRKTEAGKLERLMKRRGKMSVPLIGEGPKMIEGDDRLRAQKCLQGIQEICAEFDCVLIPSARIIGGPDGSTQTVMDIGIHPLPREAKGVSKDDIRPGDGQVRDKQPDGAAR